MKPSDSPLARLGATVIASWHPPVESDWGKIASKRLEAINRWAEYGPNDDLAVLPCKTASQRHCLHHFIRVTFLDNGFQECRPTVFSSIARAHHVHGRYHRVR